MLEVIQNIMRTSMESMILESRIRKGERICAAMDMTVGNAHFGKKESHQVIQKNALRLLFC